MNSLISSVRLVVATMLICVAGYTGLILAFAQGVAPRTAEGSLIRNSEGQIIGSRLIAQGFEQPRYFWPRPSAAGRNGYDATAGAGSNKSPTSSDLSDRARSLVERHGATEENPLPADLAAASGGGLDPHITERAAFYQAARVANARLLPQSEVEDLVEQVAFTPGGFFTSDRIVNVLELNLALDAFSAPP